MREKLIVREQLDNVIGRIQNELLRGIISFIFSPSNLGVHFMEAPGATTGNHHSYPGGLAYHTVHAAELGEKISEHYLALGFTVDVDMVIAGILLHDIGKICAYEVKGRDEAGVHQIDKTPHERLWHHIPTGAIMISKLIGMYDKRITPELEEKLIHIILSHHGRKSWSSPEIPQFLEAYIVHIVEFMDGMIEKYADGKVPTNIYDH